jgi:hypothetical protein
MILMSIDVAPFMPLACGWFVGYIGAVETRLPGVMEASGTAPESGFRF